MKSGRFCVPFWMATYEKKTPLRKAVGTIYSDDDGKTWQRGDIAIANAGEPNIAALPDGRVIVTARNNHKRSRRLVTYSANGATGWSKPAFAEELLEPGCMAGITAHHGTAAMPGPLLLFSNPHTTDREHSARRDVAIKLSRDDGMTWPVSKTLQPGPSAYSDLAVLPDGTVLCFLESGTEKPVIQRKRDWAYANLTLARFNLEWVVSKP
jgi:sialidase-1